MTRTLVGGSDGRGARRDPGALVLTIPARITADKALTIDDVTLVGADNAVLGSALIGRQPAVAVDYHNVDGRFRAVSPALELTASCRR
jgi:hypothetical protein